ncbi:GNAT family N-acetyltransferase [Paludisphaera mucosa]|uniref:GNAT family N-acetyltransferase n=1 Tax=Paludisphaera mucosa TaxID=3030827 RepID=A0ABT6FFS0_9BACT|nr:GNAT family N-acetyltransferase [Paludisphaera mucosa]MDG3006349.1 GNAT family N-acetyltransferase [Paludisphaera mucosa]
MSQPDPSPLPKASFTIRPAVPGDTTTIANLIRELAIYEKLDQFAKATAADFHRNLFGPRPFAEVLIAEVGGQPVGLALFFHTFSTFRGQPGIYLEDLFVQPEHRGKGIGKALLGSLAKLARERGCGRLEWAVLDWNEPAIGFYKSLGAGPLDEWITYRIADEALDRLANEAPEA